MTHPSPKRNMVPKAVLMRSGLVSLTTARPVNTAQPKTTVNNARPMTNIFNKAHSTVRRLINNKTTTKISNFNQKVNTARPKAVLNTVKGNQVNAVKASACWVWKPKTKVIDHVSKHNSALTILKRFDYIDAQGRSKLKEVKDYLGKCFSVKDLGEAAYILGIKIYRDRSLRLIGLNQSAYIDKILKKFSMQNSKKGFIPMEVKHDLSNEMCASSDEEKAYMKKVPYASAVGSIMYAVRCTRPDVAFAQNLVSRYQQNPGKLHWVAVKHILKYLRNTKDMFLVYGGNPDTELDVTGFCDASWQCDKDDTKSQTGYVFIVNGGAVDWKSKKQTTIAMHATQSEYMAASEAAMEAVWIRKFVGDLGVMPSINKPINMYCDNSAAIIFANEPGVMKGARHFLRRYHYVREQVESGEIKLIKVHTDKNLADAFTKALPRGKVNEHANGIGLRLASSFMHICD
ncbi:retrotransposon protein, putative, ty1-copia subclass [Tanacetum coccineum]